MKVRSRGARVEFLMIIVHGGWGSHARKEALPPASVLIFFWEFPKLLQQICQIQSKHEFHDSKDQLFLKRKCAVKVFQAYRPAIDHDVEKQNIGATKSVACVFYCMIYAAWLLHYWIASRQRGFYNSVSPFPKLTIVCTLFFCCCSQNETPHDIYIHYSNAYFPSPRLPKESYVAADYRTMKFTRTFCLFFAFKDFWGLATGSLKCHPT